MAAPIATAREALHPRRLILAAKAAVAASVAWVLAPYVPFADADYAYYAPLGVLISMYHTVAGSARAGVRTLAGLAIGIALGLGLLGLVFHGLPAVVGIALAIGVGLLFGGIRALGEGRDWVAIAALFVLLLGGAHADRFSASYLLTTAFGVLIGIVANLLIVPPLYLQHASRRLTTLRDSVCTALREIGSALEEGSVDPVRMRSLVDDLAELLPTVSGEVETAEESSLVNPRGRGRKTERTLNSQRMTALERTTRATIDLGEALLDAARNRRITEGAVRIRLAAAVSAVADLVEAPASDPRAVERLSAAEAEVDEVLAALAAVPQTVDSEGRSAFVQTSAAVLFVRRIIDASREFVAETG